VIIPWYVYINYKATNQQDFSYTPLIICCGSASDESIITEFVMTRLQKSHQIDCGHCDGSVDHDGGSDAEVSICHDCVVDRLRKADLL